MRRVEVPTYTATIFLGGEFWEAEECCRLFCRETPLCVTVEATRFVHTDGAESGVRVGLINYGRLPADADTIFSKAEALAVRLMDFLEQESASIVGTDRTVWLSRRALDLAQDSAA